MSGQYQWKDLNEQTKRYRRAKIVRGIAWKANTVFPCLPSVQSVLSMGGRRRCNICAVMTPVVKNVAVATIELSRL